MEVGKSYFILNFAFKVDHFNWVIPSGSPFLNIFYVLDAWGASIYIVYNLKMMTNNISYVLDAWGCFDLYCL